MQWSNVIDHTFNLTQVFRQKDPSTSTGFLNAVKLINYPAFVEMLNEMRFGKLSADSIRRFHALSRELPDDDGFVATELCVSPFCACLLAVLNGLTQVSPPRGR